MSQKTWGGRFSGETDNRVEAFTESISLDRRLYRHDVMASQAHARMLAEVGLLTAERPTPSSRRSTPSPPTSSAASSRFPSGSKTFIRTSNAP